MRKTKKLILTVALFTLSITGMTACGENRTPNSSILASPENVYLCHNQTAEDTTEYILTWDEVENADGYEIEAFGKTFETEETSYDFTAYCQAGKSEKYSVKAVGRGYADSKATGVREKAEALSEGLTFNKLMNGGYEVLRPTAETVSGRWVLPDTYKGKAVTKTGVSGNEAKGSEIDSVRFPKHLEIIGYRTFLRSKLEEVDIPEGVKTIGEVAFGVTETLKKVNFSDTVTSIQEGAFSNCGIEELFLPSNVAYLGENVFGNCQQLKKVVFEEGSRIKELPYALFFCCKSLSEINIPDGVEKIGENAFLWCDFTEIKLPANLQSIGYQAFSSNQEMASLYIPKGVTELKAGALGISSSNLHSFVSFTVAEENPAYKSVDGNVYSKDGTELIQYALAKTETEFTVPDGVTKIGDFAFQYASNLRKVKLPQGVKEIGVEAFAFSSLEEINIPDGLTTLREEALNAANIKKLILPDSVTAIEEMAIGHLHLEEIRIPPRLEVFGQQNGLHVEILEIPEGMKLGLNQFMETVIEKIVFPKTFDASAGRLFAGLFGAPVIPDIFYKGTEAELSQLIKDGLVSEDAFTGAGGPYAPGESSATVYFYSEEEPPLNEDGTAYDGNYWRYVDGVPTVWEK